ncbi:MAG TPA: glutaminyl-peptide cyclotransferase [Lacunisphaera sp.]|jgi:glutamine cyclotransferase
MKPAIFRILLLGVSCVGFVPASHAVKPFTSGGGGAGVLDNSVFPLGEEKAPVPKVADAATEPVQLYTFEIVNAWPHDRGAFTQGLVYLDGSLLESTGLNGESSLRKTDLKTGAVVKEVKLSEQYFAEGLALLDGRLFQLTWQNQKAFVYGLGDFKLEREFTYAGEGWGLTTDGVSLVMSDGTSQIRFLDPATFTVKRRITVRMRGRVVDRLNELEYVKGAILANVWGSDDVVRIDPATGQVTAVIDFSGLLPAQDRDENTDVLNGIAYDVTGDRLLVTGKHWPKVFEVRLRLKKESYR